MGTKTVTKTVTLIPSSYSNSTNMSASSSYPITNGYADESNTSYARFTVSQNATGYIFYIFDASAIPANATITSISAKAHVRVNNTSRVTDTKCQLFNGTGVTHAKGSNSTFASTSTSYVVTLDAGSWTRSELSDIRLKIGGTGYNGTSSRYIYFYGASVTITYTYTVTTYDITVQNSTSATVGVDKSEADAGDDVIVYANTISGISIKDNGVDVTSQFVLQTTDVETCVPGGYADYSGFSLSSISNAYTDADSDTYATLNVPSGGTACSILLNFNYPRIIPYGATIVSVSCKATFGYNRNNSSSGFTASCRMYYGNAPKGSATTILSSGGSNLGKTTFTLSDVGTWTLDELYSARFYITATNSASGTTRYLYLYGVSLEIEYELDEYYYIYTIENISANHAIVVTSQGTQTIYYKESGTWKSAASVYKKVNGSWVLQSNLSNVFDPQKNYVKGN